MTAAEIRPREVVGADVLGVDLSRVDIGTIDQIEAAFAAFGLLIIPNQSLSDEDLRAFAANLGELSSSSEFRGVSGRWHSHDSFEETPSAGEVVHVRTNSEVRCQWQFANTYAAWDALSSTTQRALEGLHAVHQLPGAPGSQQHPIVIRHPRSGRPTLYVNPYSTHAVDGMQEPASLALLNELFAHTQRPEFVSTVPIEAQTVLLWDPRAVWLLEDALLEDASDNREDGLLRVSLAGRPLRAAVQQDARDHSLVERAGATLAGGIVTAAMLGIAEVLEPERSKQDIEIVSDAPEDEPPMDLSFGDLPPLG